MKRILFLLSPLLLPYWAVAQGVGIGIDVPHESATLHVQSLGNNGGLLIPRVSSNDRINTIPSPAEGLLVYDLTLHTLMIYTNNQWQYVGPPRGTIVMWSGDVADIPSGWVLCNGANSTPDLRGRFIVSLGQNTSPALGDLNPTYTVGQTGGRNQVALTTAQIPSHTHTATISNGGAHTHSYNRHTSKQVGTNSGGGEPAADPGGSTATATSSAGSHAHTATINATGGGQPHENRPPYYALAFIMKQ